MAEILEESTGLESTTIGIYRTAATVKGGRRFSFSALVAVGDRNGNVGLGYGKAPGVPAAIEKAQKNARKKMTRIKLQEDTLPHQITGRSGSSTVKLIPASQGTGVIAGGTARAVLELAGVKNCLTKAMGSTNQKNLARAVMDGLNRLTNKQEVQELRGVELGNTRVEEILEAGRRYAPVASDAPKAKAPQALKPQRGKGKGKGGKGGRGRKAGRGGKGAEKTIQSPSEAKTEQTETAEDKPDKPAEAPQAEAPKTDAPASESPKTDATENKTE
ncbi:MAG: 30S ribosomal protein S5 [Phycisphaeraceae bacterium]|nr:30S ribosomal protein S5 [Phycisphaeraceae bacterium]